MKIWMIVAVCAFVFLVCFLLDTLFKHLFPKSKLEKSKQAVRPARRSATFGVILLFVPVVVLLFFMPKESLCQQPDAGFSDKGLLSMYNSPAASRSPAPCSILHSSDAFNRTDFPDPFRRPKCAEQDDSHAAADDQENRPRSDGQAHRYIR